MKSALVSDPKVTVIFRMKRVVVPAALPGRGCSIHHTQSAGAMVSTLIGLAVLWIVLSDSRIQTWLLLMEHTSMRSLKKDVAGCNFIAPFGLLADTVRSSSDSPDDADEEEVPEEAPKESSDSGVDILGVALTGLDGELTISVGGRICCNLRGRILRSSNHGKRLHSRAEGR